MRKDSIDLIKVLNESEEDNKPLDGQTSLFDKDLGRVFVHGKDKAESIEDALNNYDTYEYECYHCNKPTHYRMKNWIAKNRNWGNSDEEILDSLNGPYPPICAKCTR